MKKQALSVHCHFYQPQRENPFTGTIPVEEGAAPFPNWNERIYSQCYQPNAELGNFSRISFNIGPTLAEWIAKEHPDTLQEIVRQENEVYAKDGVGNGMAQPYNHTILPLATHEDRVTQIHWGLYDFETRFGHKPAGMWLPETAVDLDSLSILADYGIRFTILAPWQAKRKNDVDCSVPYYVDLGDGKRISVFFYEKDLSAMVSFSPDRTENADNFLCENVMPLYPEDARRERMYMIASDGELYGHHQPLREKFLEWLTTGALEGRDIELTYPGLWLEQHPATKEIRIKEKTSWSCHHGVKRWSTVCPCAEHGEWKAGLRRSFNRIATVVDEEMQKALDPYGLGLLEFRNEYCKVLCHTETADEQLDRLIGRDSLDETERRKLTLLMRAQYERQRMFTSCGWFFGDFDRIEVHNNIAAAAGALSLLKEATGADYINPIRRSLQRVVSPVTGNRASNILDNMLKIGQTGDGE